MNLQVSIPYQQCVYKCPMCVARGHKNTGTFENLYETDPKEWAKRLCEAAKDKSAVVITGECDPTQNMKYVNDVARVLWNCDDFDGDIEFTTHNQHFDNWGLNHCVKVITLSVTNVREYLNAWKVISNRNAIVPRTYRMVILLTNEFDFLTPENFNTMGFDQVTFKTLQYGEDGDVNRWIYEHKMSDEQVENIRKIVDKFNSFGECSVRLDTSCQTADGRYEIFRCDGNVYESWEAMEPNGKLG